MNFAIIGAGMAGILSAIKLTEAGLTDFTIYEKSDRFGGTWRENTYPGLACDVPSHLYSYSFAPNPDWSHQFSPGPEIHAYFERVAREHGLEEQVRFGDEVVRCEFSDGRWKLETASGHHDEVDVVIAATGVLHHPRYPDIEGLDTFAGAMFHSSRWDHDVELDGARVGVIGTGSTAVQIVGAIVDRVGHLDLFQRTPQWVLPQVNPAITDEEKAAFRERPVEADRAAREPLAGVRRLRQRGRRRGVRRGGMDPGRVPREPRGERRGSRAARAAAPRVPGGVQAAHHLAELLRGDAGAELRARHRGDRGGRARRGPHQGRRAARARRAGARHRLLRRRVHAPDGRRSAATARRSPTRGRSGRTRTCRSRSPTSRTSSC